MVLRPAPILLLVPLAFALAACGAAPVEAPAGPPPSATPVPSAVAEAPPPPVAVIAPAAPIASTAPPPAADPPPVASAENKARTDFAVGFVTAVAKRDKAALATYLAAEDFCKAMAATSKKKPAVNVKTCVKEMGEQSKEGLEAFNQLVPGNFEVGTTEVMDLAPSKGIYMVAVRAKGIDPKGPDADKSGVTVTLLEAEGKRFVVFPQKSKHGATK